MTCRMVRALAGLLLLHGTPTGVWSQSGPIPCGQVPPGILTPGQQVKVTLRRAGADQATAVIQGRLLAWSPDTITIERAPAHVVIGLRDVSRIERRRRVGRTFLTSVAVAGAAMTLIDLGSGNPEPASAFAMGGVFFGIPAGAILNARARSGPLCESP